MCNKCCGSCSCKPMTVDGWGLPFKVGDKVMSGVHPGEVVAILPKAEVYCQLVVLLETGSVITASLHGFRSESPSTRLVLRKEKKSITVYINVYGKDEAWMYSTEKEALRRVRMKDAVGVAIPFTYEWEE